MSGFSGGSFSFSRSGHRRGMLGRRSHSSGHRAGGMLGGALGGLMGGSRSSGRRGHYAQGGHYRQVGGRRGGCLGLFALGAGIMGSGVAGLVSLIA